MNFLKGKVDAGAFRSEAGTSLPLPSTRGVSEGSPIIYGVRPEHFQLNGHGVPARVTVIEPTGSETQVMAEFAGSPIIAAFRERVSARPGETIHMTPDPAMVHLFDANTGQRMSA
jgi:multiple sugar transport system ATP-binding protein